MGIVGGDGCESRRWARACLAGLRCRAMVDDDDSAVMTSCFFMSWFSWAVAEK